MRVARHLPPSVIRRTHKQRNLQLTAPTTRPAPGSETTSISLSSTPGGGYAPRPTSAWAVPLAPSFRRRPGRLPPGEAASRVGRPWYAAAARAVARTHARRPLESDRRAPRPQSWRRPRQSRSRSLGSPPPRTCRHCQRRRNKDEHPESHIFS